MILLILRIILLKRTIYVIYVADNFINVKRGESSIVVYIYIMILLILKINLRKRTIYVIYVADFLANHIKNIVINRI